MVRRWRLIGHFPILYNPGRCGTAGGGGGGSVLGVGHFRSGRAAASPSPSPTFGVAHAVKRAAAAAAAAAALTARGAPPPRVWGAALPFESSSFRCARAQQLQAAMKKVFANRNGVGRVGDRSRGRFATPADSPLQDCSPYSHVHVRRGSLGFVHRSRAILCRAKP
jgi:hypothetical protein